MEICPDCGLPKGRDDGECDPFPLDNGAACLRRTVKRLRRTVEAVSEQADAWAEGAEAVISIGQVLGGAGAGALAATVENGRVLRKILWEASQS